MQAALEPRVRWLSAAEWTAAAGAHEDRADALTAGARERAARGEKHPVEDFLTTYYSLRPGRLRRWNPGAGVALAAEAGTDLAERAGWPDHSTLTRPDGVHGVTLDLRAFHSRRGDAVRHLRELLAATAGRAPALGCFGLHEWAMVYRLAPDDVRHPGWPLRLGPAGTDEVVDSHRLRCSHHDAFRFFTAAARPLNEGQPRRQDAVALEQPGCLHATMDLYKWAYKLGPAVPGDLLLDCLELARAARELDMRASPYDLRALGYPPVPIETPEGKAAYVAGQRALAERAAPLRRRLLAVCDVVLGVGEPGGVLT